MKRNKNFAVINYGKDQIAQFDPSQRQTRKPFIRQYSWRVLPRRQILRESHKRSHANLSSIKRFNVGDTVYAIVIDSKSFTRTIVKTKIVEVAYFGYPKRGLIGYWVKDIWVGHGIDGDDLFKTRNEAKHFLFF